MTELTEIHFKAIENQTLFPTPFKDNSDCNSSKQFPPADVISHGEQLHGNSSLWPNDCNGFMSCLTVMYEDTKFVSK